MGMPCCVPSLQTCERYALHPTDADAWEEHVQQCAARHRRLASLAASQEVRACIPSWAGCHP